MSTAVAALSVTALGVPAMLAAGVASSPHCALMCGALYARSNPAIDFDRLFGRLVAYAAIGALAGGAGEWLLRAADWAGSGQVLRLALLPLMVWLLVRTNRASKAPSCCVRPTPRASASSHARRLAAGFATGLVPCPLLYAAAGYAMLAGGAPQGALLLLAFGIGTTPAVQAGAWMWARAAGRPSWSPAVITAACAGALIAALGAPVLVGWCVG